MFAQGSGPATFHEPDSHATTTKSSNIGPRFWPKHWHKVIPRCMQPLAHKIYPGSTLQFHSPNSFNILFTASNILFCDIYIDNVNGQSKIVSKRGGQGGGGRRGDDDRRPEMSGDL